ncbi:hypothetical protein BJ508DRAFT_322130 [Ascobolus immersus RN42]|uniref:Uncharacterized protein n=1 Tax=Ascobolus immersus RN42 TaxID=1160509 RepID=A0A3N4IP75_ASCIM|nr:hypothetical protein BJ508DRAFT_322130 [Ascobolus immersus RN42]
MSYYDDAGNQWVSKKVSWTLPKSPLGELEPDPNIGNTETYTLLVKEYRARNGEVIVLVSNPFKVRFEKPPVPLPSRTKTTVFQPAPAPTSNLSPSSVATSVPAPSSQASSDPSPESGNAKTDGASAKTTTIEDGFAATAISTVSFPVPSTIRVTVPPTTSPDAGDSRPSDNHSGVPLAGIIGGCSAGVLVLLGITWGIIAYRRKARGDNAVKKRAEDSGDYDESESMRNDIPWYMRSVPSLEMETPLFNDSEDMSVVAMMYPDDKVLRDSD